MGSVYQRPALATQMAAQILKPGVLDEGLRSGLFLSGLRRTGKTTFLINDLIPELQNRGAVVIYVDLWSDTQASAAALVLAAVQKTLDELQTPASSILKKLGQVRGVDVGAFTFKFGVKLGESLGTKSAPTLAEVIRAIVDQAKTDVVLIVDEVQHAISSEDGGKMLLALKSARDGVNPRPGTPGHFIFIGTGSHRALVNELTTRKNQAFSGATSVAYPVLDGHFVAHLLGRLAAEGASGPLPSLPVATSAFTTLGSRPEEMLKALRLLRQLAPGADPDEFLPTIAMTLRSAAADIEIRKVEELGSLAMAIFDRIAAIEGEARGLFSADAAASYSEAIGREVPVDDVQPIVNELLAANLIMRKGHGVYLVTDPFVQEMWREKKSLEGKT